MQPMMACGHQAHGFLLLETGENVPACIICDPPDNRTVVGMPDLTGREAKCAYGDTIKPSTDALEGKLAFFEYRGPGSPDSVDRCKHCPYLLKAHDYFPYYYPGRCQNCNADALTYIGGVAHMWGCGNCTAAFTNSEVSGPKRKPPNKNKLYKPHRFEANGAFEYDRFYCGCRGWD